MTEGNIAEARSSPRRVVVIEDAPECRRLIRKQLAVEQLEVFEAADGATGLALCRTLRPMLVLLDLVMPHDDGFAILRQLQQEPETRGVPVIFLSGQATLEQRVAGLDLGAVDFVIKPFHGKELRARIRAALRIKEQRDLLERLAHLDGLTGLGNRRAFEDRLATAWAQARRRGTPLSIFLADLDHFKRINDRHGHSVGDSVLRGVAETLRGQIREGDFAGRFGGEEFVVVALDCDEFGAVEMAERFRRALAAESYSGLGLDQRVTVSVGAATEVRPAGGDGRHLLERADQALYRAKHSGRDAVWYWDTLTDTPQPASALELISARITAESWNTMCDDR